MKFAFQAIFAIVLLLVTAHVVFATHGIAFSQSSCYQAPLVQQQVHYDYQNYEQQVVLPLNTYGYNTQAQLIVLPQKVEVIRPEIRLQLEQVQPNYYAAPLALQQKTYFQQQFVQKQRVQKFVAPQKVVVQKQVLRQRQNDNFRRFEFRGPFGGSITREVQR
jgi:hypothetical protein